MLQAGLARLLLDPDSDFVERRAYTRLKVRFAAFLDVSGQRFQVRGVDLHRGGAGINSQAPLPIGMLAFFYSKPFGLVGWATVRWCTPRGPGEYRIGLEFRGPLMRAEAGRWHFSCIPSVPTEAGRPAAARIALPDPQTT